MAAPSAFFNELNRRLQELRTKFLDVQLASEKANPLTFKPDTDSLAAFRLLVHAEIEDYLEQKARHALKSLTNDVTATGFVIRSRRELYVLAALFKVELAFDCPFDAQRFLMSARTVLDATATFITENNGIKSRIFMVVALLHGKDMDEIDASLANTLNEYGSARGDVAHVSASRVRTIQAPSTELKNADDLVNGLRAFFY
jgi:hypothetical protein